MAKANIANTQVVPVESTVFPYYDDFSEDKNFHRILFRPGYAVQARELTQLQTILQNQIERFGSHIFAEGSLVLGGQISTDFSTNMITLNSQFANTDINLVDFSGQVINEVTGDKKARAKVIAIDSSVATAPVLAIKYLSGSEFANNDTIQVNNTTTNASISLVTNSIKGSTVQVREGIFFISGYFVKAPTQTIILEKNSATPSYRVGLELQDDIITEDSDASLLDPAQESYNYQAPGATRYQVNLVLSKRPLNDDSDTSKFIELLRVRNGVIQKVIKYPTYSEIEKTLARRTYDESGDYTIDPFLIELKANTQNTSLVRAILDPGKAYVKGYEFETIAPTDIIVEKARTTAPVENYNLSMPGGNYIIVEKIRAKGNSFFNTSILEKADIHCVKHANVATSSTNAYNSTKIGTTYIKNMTYDSSTFNQNSDAYRYKAYLFDTNFVSLTSDNAFSNANSVIFRANAYIIGSGASTRTYVLNDLANFTGEFRLLYNVYLAPNEIRLYQGNDSSQTDLIGSANAVNNYFTGVFAPTEGENLEHERLGGSRFVGVLGRGPALGIDDQGRFGIIRAGHGTSKNYYKVEVLGGSPFEFSYSVRQNNATQLVQLANLANATAAARVSSVNGAYEDVVLRIYEGNARGYKGTITAYNGTTRTATVTPAFTGLLPNTSSKFSLTFDETDIESIVTGTTNKDAVADISISSKIGGVEDGDSFIEDKSFSPLIFQLPNAPVAANSIAEQEFSYNKLFSSVEFNSSGIAQISADTGEAFVGDGLLSDSEILENYTVIITNNRGSTNVANGQLLAFTRSGYSITVDAGTGIANLTTGIASADIPDGFTAKVITRQNINTGNKRLQKTKTRIVGNNVQLLSFTAADGRFGASNTSVYLNAGQVFITNPNKVNGQGDNLYISDVINLVKVYESTSNAIAANTRFSGGGLSDVTNKYTLDNGQNDSFYDHAKIILRPGVAPPKGAIVAVVNYFRHDLTPGDGYFSVDSYNSIDYGQIPEFTDKKTGEIYRLRDCIDFRPARTNATNTESTFSLTGNKVPIPDSSFDLDYAYYLPRIDKLVLTRERDFEVIKGKPRRNPQEPKEGEDDMLLYTLTIPPYTFSPKDIEIKFHENRRYTMRDIGQIDRRVKNLEYYATLSLLEKQATDKPVFDNRGLERTKYGIVVDSFGGHAVGDVRNPDYRIAIDKNAGEMRPSHHTRNIDLDYERSGAYADVDRKNNVFILKHTEEEYITQPYATKNISVTDFLIAKFDGNLKLVPESDIWHEDEILPDVIVNIGGENDAWKTISRALSLIEDEDNPFGKEWNDWETISTGKPRLLNSVSDTDVSKSNWVQTPNPNDNKNRQQRTVTTTTTVSNTYSVKVEQSRTGTQTSLTTEVVNKSLGAKVVDSSIIPYIRSRPINYLSEGLRPERRYFHWFDNTNIDEYIARPNEIVINKLNSIRFRGLESGEGEQLVSGQNSAPLILVNGRTLYVGPENGDDFQNFDVTSDTYFVSKGRTANNNAATLTQRSESYTFTKNGTVFIFYNTYAALNSVEIYRSNGTVNISNTAPIFVANSTYTDGRKPNKAELRAYLSIPYSGANVAPSRFIGPFGQPSELGENDQNRFGIFELDFDKSEGNTIHVVVGNNQVSGRGSPYQYAISLNRKESELLTVGQTIIGSITGATANIASINHYTGSARPISGTTATNRIALARTASSVNNYYVGNTVFIVSGQGAGQSALITSYNGTTKIATVNVAWTSVPISNSIYSIGHNQSNEDGDLPGTFFIPATEDLKFRTGERLMKVTDSVQNDDDDATSKASTLYHAMGLLNTKQGDVLSTRVPVIDTKTITKNRTVTDRFNTTEVTTAEQNEFRIYKDPIAQTFMVSSAEYPQGLFLTSVDLYFARKDDRLPVYVELRPTVNGYPSSSIIHPHSTVTLKPASVNVSTVPSVTQANTATTFTFKSPVYLPPGEHAFVVGSDSAEYEVFVCEVGQTQIGTGARISKQPYLGSSFRSQNSTTWTPFQFEDIMFKLNKARFTLGTGTVLLTNAKINTKKNYDGVYLTTEELKFAGTSISYELKTNVDNYFDIIPDRTTMFQPSGGSYTQREVGPGQGTMNVRVRMTTTNPDLTPVLDLDRVSVKAIENIVTNGGITDGLIKVKEGGTGYNAASISITGGGGVGANAYARITDDGEIEAIVVTAPGSGYFGTPTITITGDGSGAVASFNSEESGSGGNMKARYITRKVTLADGFDAGDLKVYLDAYKPTGTDLSVYYKVLNSTDNTEFEQRPYIQMTQVGKDVRSRDESEFIEYEFVPNVSEGKIKYNPNDDQNQFKTFKYFAIKIVLTARFSSIVPKVKNLRIMALPESD
jgi:hypothetical protein